jgi:phenylacetate-CoA ligase
LGRPVTIKVTNVTGTFFTALHLRYHLWHGRDLTATVCALQPLRKKRHLEAAKAGTALPWVPVYFTGRMYFLDSRVPIREQFDWLIRHEPQYLLTQPSNLRALIQHSRHSGTVPRGLSQVSTISEIVEPSLREDCTEVWGATICDVYSCEEMGMVAIQCPDHPHYHVQSESVFVEILNEWGEACAPGETRRVVATDLHNFAMPLIRYETGDYGQVGTACPCGRGLPVLSRIMGRQRNMLTLPSGDTMWPSYHASLFLSVAPVRQIQLIQHSLEEIEVKLVVAEPMIADQEERLRANLAESFGHPFRFRFTYSEEIPTGPGGKFEDFVSKLPRLRTH